MPILFGRGLRGSLTSAGLVTGYFASRSYLGVGLIIAAINAS